MKKIIFFCNGNPESASTWSNVPYCFVRALREKGIEVISVQLSSIWLEKCYDFFIRYIFDMFSLLFRRKRTLYFAYTNLYRWIANKGIQKALKKHNHADYCFFIGYQLYNKYNNIPSLLLSDWSQEISLTRSGKKIDYIWKDCVAVEEEAITHAQHVITIFPKCAEQMRDLYPNANIHYLGGNVVNNLAPQSTLPEGEEEKEVIKIKKDSKTILFIGKPDRYKESAIMLIEAVGLLRQKKEFSDFELDIIGIRKVQLPQVPDYVHCHGYLHKDNTKENKTYYDLLRTAKVIVNPTPKWAAYSSTIEAMYFYTPLIVSPYEDFVEEFGKDINFGLYNCDFTAECIAKNIEIILNLPDYEALCLNSHKAVKDYTWENYVSKVLALIKD